ncbi:hypothetical protein [Paraglaciecola sp. 25GB23A]|uniref:hypothetical protein n=1 Tax=Paraglaciecola sp. 25GB23A TaxID=3156068 RepID=UPI0032AF7404
MRNTNHAIAVCQQIQRLGKTPTVALIKHYSTQTLSIPEIIKALQMWKNNPHTIVEEPAIVTPANLGLEDRVLSLEKKVAELSSQLAAFLAR